ncbi:hypothetical protein WJ542_06210 [Paraburkholderia sp. B3]|uniref:hypothetical protein n=1 Tax=Paraburkholderia sp. B3 TaxID=3134791 RepID=UPI003982B5F6
MTAAVTRRHSAVPDCPYPRIHEPHPVRSRRALHGATDDVIYPVVHLAYCLFVLVDPLQRMTGCYWKQGRTIVNDRQHQRFFGEKTAENANCIFKC